MTEEARPWCEAFLFQMWLEETIVVGVGDSHVLDVPSHEDDLGLVQQTFRHLRKRLMGLQGSWPLHLLGKVIGVRNETADILFGLGGVLWVGRIRLLTHHETKVDEGNTIELQNKEL